MGAESSQNQIIDLEEATENRTLKPWEIENRFLNDTNQGTVPLDNAFPIIQKILNTFKNHVNILEVGSGNGYNTKKIAELNNIASLKATDIYDYKKRYYEVSVESSDDAVKNYIGDIDILLIISPPPNDGYMDYYAIKEYELKSQSSPKYLIFIGELGASDGTTGIYQYLTNQHKKLSDWVEISNELYRLDSRISIVERRVWLFKYI